MTKIEEINEFMLTTFGEQGITDTPENRLAFLDGLQEAWRDPEVVAECTPGEKLTAVLYRVALAGEIGVLQMKLQGKRWEGADSPS